MINGNYSEFLDHLYYGDELWIKYKGVVYFRNAPKSFCSCPCLTERRSPKSSKT